MLMVTLWCPVPMTGGLFSGTGKVGILSFLSILVIVTMFSRLRSCLTPMIEALSLVLLMDRYNPILIPFELFNRPCAFSFHICHIVVEVISLSNNAIICQIMVTITTLSISCVFRMQKMLYGFGTGHLFSYLLNLFIFFRVGINIMLFSVM